MSNAPLRDSDLKSASRVDGRPSFRALVKFDINIKVQPELAFQVVNHNRGAVAIDERRRRERGRTRPRYSVSFRGTRGDSTQRDRRSRRLAAAVAPTRPRYSVSFQGYQEPHAGSDYT
jgi:hypothetical protein